MIAAGMVRSAKLGEIRKCQKAETVGLRG